MNKAPFYDLSKFSILYGMQCEKRLYWHVKERASRAPMSATMQALADEARNVEAVARRTFPAGVTIAPIPFNAEEAVNLTRLAISKGEKSLFHAAFVHNGVFIRVDVLDRLANGHWRLIDIKAGIRVQRKQLLDLAIQYWVMAGIGVAIDRCEVMYLNKDYVHPNTEGLFCFEDVTSRVIERLTPLPELVDRFRGIVHANEAPVRDIGRHCRLPTVCNFEERCRPTVTIPPVSVFNIPKLEIRAKWELYQQGKADLVSVRDLPWTPSQRRMIESTISGKRFTNPRGIARAMALWKKPFYYLDFETISPLVPTFTGLHPGDSIPFQFSVRTLLEGQMVEYACLHADGSDPRPILTKKILNVIGSTGSIVTYSKASEKAALLTLATFASSADALRLRAMAFRLVDALPIMRAHVYDPAFAGSFSLKDVAPALFGQDFNYDHLKVGDGQAAQRAYLRLVSNALATDEKEALRRAMLYYCGQDTEALARLTQWLQAQTV